MTGESTPTETLNPIYPITRHPSLVTSSLAVLFAATALVVAFWGLLQLDVPVARFMRSVHLPWLEFLGDLAHRLGSGPSLLIVSAIVLLVGWRWQKPTWRQAGLHALVAHGIVAVIVHALKHLVGRPRPRFMHGNGFAFGPSWVEGLDSFPSGHTSASFAVATVLAHHFPRGRWWFYLAATLVGFSRVLRGSHFPTDVLAGVVLGVLAGTVVISPVREWGVSLARRLVQVAPFVVLVFGFLWTALRVQPQHWSSIVMAATGVLVIVVGLALRLYGRRNASSGGNRLRSETVLIAVGLGLTTGSPLLATLALFVAAAHVLYPAADPSQRPLSSLSTHAEIGLAIALAIAVFLLHAVKGILPLL